MPTFTKQAIKANFWMLLKQYPLRDITVKMIVEHCGINRKSFYYHYQDVPALLGEIIKERIDKMLENFHDVSSIEDGLDIVLRDLIAEKTAIQHIYYSVSRDVFEAAQMQLCDYVVRGYIHDIAAKYALSEQDEELLVRFYRGQCFGIIMDWMMQGMPEDVFTYLHRICSIRYGFAEELAKKLSSTPA